MKNIDNIFKDKLKNLEVSPSDKVWDNIASNLKSKKKRRVVPFWWYSGAASILLVTLLLLNPFKKSANKPILNDESIIVSSPEKEEKQIKFVKEKEPIIVENNLKEKEKSTPLNLAIKKLPYKKDENLAINTPHIQEKNTSKNIVKEEPSSSNVLNKEKKPSISIAPKKDFIAKVVEDSQNKKNKEIENLKEKVSKKWSLTPVVGLISSNSFSSASPLDQTLINNPTEGTNSFSYGIKIDYQISKRWSIQTGIHMQKADYTNNNLSIVANVSGSGISGVNSDVQFSMSSSSPSNNLPLLTGAKVVSSSATLTQTYGYIEVPLEVKYTFFESSKFDTKFVTGFSSLFLNENNVFVNSEVISQKIGEANNLNSINFSGNFGLDLDYTINSNFKLNFNPMFKVQLNTFSRNSNGFKPFIIGLYSGLKYTF